MLQESYRAFLAVDNREDARIVQMMNGDIVTHSEVMIQMPCLNIP